MKKLLALVVAGVASMGIAVPVAQATDLGPTNFNVKVNLTAICQITSAGPYDVDFGVYTAFTGAATPAPTTDITIECTRKLAAPTYSFDALLGGTDGVIAGLNYTLAAAQFGATGAGTDASIVGPTAGTADTRTIRITGGMVAGQAGECTNNAAAACAGVQTQVRTLTISY